MYYSITAGRIVDHKVSSHNPHCFNHFTYYYLFIKVHIHNRRTISQSFHLRCFWQLYFV